MTTTPFTLTDELARKLSKVVSQIPGVDHLDGGHFGENSTYTRLGVVKGISYDSDSGHLHVALVARWPYHLLKLANTVRKAITRYADVPVDVYINDLVEPTPTSET